MHISPNHNSGPVSRIWAKATSGAPGATSSDSASFEGAAALERALADTPDVRADRVEHARQLISDGGYPPAQTVKRIASLLGKHLDPNQAEE